MQPSDRGWLYAVGFLSVAGVPPLVGFMPKFLIRLNGVCCGVGVLVVGFLVASVIHVGYYIDLVISGLSSQALVGWCQPWYGAGFPEVWWMRNIFLVVHVLGGLGVVVRVADIFV